MTRFSLSEAGAKAIQNFEMGGQSPEKLMNAHRDPVGVWQIGFGHTKGVTPGMQITMEDVYDLFRRDTHEIEDWLNTWLSVHEVGINQAQFDALVSFIYNFGAEKFRKSTLARVLDTEPLNHEEVAHQLKRWVNGVVDGEMQQLPGLIKRRAWEASAFLDQFGMDSSADSKAMRAIETAGYEGFVKNLTPKNYEAIARRLSTPAMVDMIHAFFGLISELGELVDPYKKYVFYDKPVDAANVDEELGDLCWYLTVALNRRGISLAEILESNMTKLNKRYPTGAFSEEQAKARADKNHTNARKMPPGLVDLGKIRNL